MTAGFTTSTSLAPARGAFLTPATRRGGIMVIIAIALIAGFLATSTQATNLAILNDGAALVRLMRFMAAIKTVMIVAPAAAILWRFGTTISLRWFAAYAVTTASMAAGPGLIWGMAHVGLGALLLHGGLFATIILLWVDPGVRTRLADVIAARRQHVSARSG